MNIFVTHSDPTLCAKFLDNKRVVKMLLETAQLLSTALSESGVSDSRLYRATHRSHPCAVWCRTSRQNYQWLLSYFDALHKVYGNRFYKCHKSYQLLREVFEEYKTVLPDMRLTQFVNCAANLSKGVNFKDEKNVHKAYRLYLRERWKCDKIKPTWRKK